MCRRTSDPPIRRGLRRDVSMGRGRVEGGFEHLLGDFVLNTSHLLRFSLRSSSRLAVILAIATSPICAPATAATVTYTNSSCSSFVISGTPPNQTVTCVAGSGGGVPVCTPTANPAAPAIGQSTTISANCSNSPNANGYTWTGGTCAGLTGSTCTVIKTRPMSITYAVSASNASGTGSAAQITITWQ
jgi:hypothetical protein